MNLHEYQAKRLFADYGLPVSVGYVVDTPDEAVAAAERIGGTAWVCKVQVRAGGRGNAGGVQLVDSTGEVRSCAERWLGTRLVTVQTDADEILACIAARQLQSPDPYIYFYGIDRKDLSNNYQTRSQESSNIHEYQIFLKTRMKLRYRTDLQGKN